MQEKFCKFFRIDIEFKKFKPLKTFKFSYNNLQRQQINY
jgi:hypothetical protein